MEANMSEYRAEPTRSGDTEAEWVDFPASSDADPWATLLRKAHRPPPMLLETQQRGNEPLPGRTPMVKVKPSNHLAFADHGLLKHHSSFADYWHANGAVMTSLTVALRGLLVTTIAVAIVAFLLLTNSHI
jgi:hypothetical protein